MIKQRLRRSKTASPNGQSLPATQNLIHLQQVVISYPTPAGDFMALRGIDLQINKGEFVAIVGKSGSGKSTLINMLTGIDHPSDGVVQMNGTAVHALSESALAQWRGRNVGIIFQFFQLLPMLTCLENIMLPMDFSNTYARRKRPLHALHLLQQVGLADQAHKLPSELSGGQQQRVAIARSLANDPPILVADEPTGNLDSQTAVAIFQLFQQLVAEGKTIVMVTHDNELASQVSRTITIADGTIVNEHYH
jgi:putative ABC transport system ATP-binding protein